MFLPPPNQPHPPALAETSMWFQSFNLKHAFALQALHSCFIAEEAEELASGSTHGFHSCLWQESSSAAFSEIRRCLADVTWQQVLSEWSSGVVSPALMLPLDLLCECVYQFIPSLLHWNGPASHFHCRDVLNAFISIQSTHKISPFRAPTRAFFCNNSDLFSFVNWPLLV